jgi:sugar lactone lactonase YvrE
VARGEGSPDASARRLRVPPPFLFLVPALTFAVSVSLIPSLLRTSSPPTGDQPFYLMDTISLVQDGDLDVANNYARHDEDFFYSLAPHPRGFTGQTAPYPLPPHLTLSPARPSSERYSYHAPGLGFLLVPAWIVGSWFHLWWPATVVFMCFLGALVGLNIFLAAFEATADLRIAVAVWAALAFSAPLLFYSILIFTELPASLLVLYSFRRFSAGWGANRPWQLALAGISVAFIPWLSWRCGAIAAVLGLYGAAQWWRFHRRRPISPRGATEAALLFGPLLISATFVALYEHFLSGKWLPDIRRPVGEILVFHWPWRGGRDLQSFVDGALALFFDQQWGLLVHSPVYLLAIAGLLAMRQAGREEQSRLRWLAFLSLPYFVLIAAFKQWGGLWCPPGRYLVPLLPLLALPLAHSLRLLGGDRAFRFVFVLLAALGFTYVALVSPDLHLIWPATRGYFWEWLSRHLSRRIDLREVLPAFAWPGDRHPFQTGWVLAAAAAVVFWTGRRMERRNPGAYPRMRGLAWSGALAALLGCWLLTSSEFLWSPRLFPEKVWGLDPPPKQAEGMTFFEGSIYVADYTGGSVWVLDLKTGRWKRLQPRQGEKSLEFVRPGDVKPGPGGLLFVLNNGTGTGALYVMRPDAEVVHQLALKGTTEVAVGLAFGDDRLYVSDMVGGGIREYRLEGGQPLLSWPVAKLNNVAGLARSRDGMLYAAESSADRVLQYDSDGNFVRGFEIGCEPRSLAIDGDWLDGSCEDRLFTINLKSRSIKRLRLSGHEISHPTSVAHGPDHTLYVLDSGSLRAFRVER